MRIEEERETGAVKSSWRESSVDSRRAAFDPVREGRERKLLQFAVGPGFADVVSGDRDRVPRGDVDRRSRRICVRRQPRPTDRGGRDVSCRVRDVSLEDVALTVPRSAVPGTPCSSATSSYSSSRSVAGVLIVIDGETSPSGNAGNKSSQRRRASRSRYAGTPDLAERTRVVRVVAELGRCRSKATDKPVFAPARADSGTALVRLLRRDAKPAYCRDRPGLLGTCPE